MKSLKYILLGSLLSLTFSFNSCDLKQNTGNNKSNDSTYSVSIKSVKTMKNDTLDILQLDSLTKADKLPEYNKHLLKMVMIIIYMNIQHYMIKLQVLYIQLNR